MALNKCIDSGAFPAIETLNEPGKPIVYRVVCHANGKHTVWASTLPEVEAAWNAANPEKVPEVPPIPLLPMDKTVNGETQ